MRILGLLILLLATPALATDYYVRTDGNDANTGLANTAGGAWKTVGKCLSTISAGNRCRIQPGTYLETAPRTLTNSGTLIMNDAMTDCKCTAGSSTITCGTTVTGITAGQFVRCDATGPYFNWTRVASVVGNVLNLDEGYRGVSSGGNTFLDVANFVEIVGDGTRDTINYTSVTDAATAGITFTPDGTWSGVYSYDVTGKPAPWNNPGGFRQDTPTWNIWSINSNGRDSLHAMTAGGCACCAATCAEQAYRVPGSWCRTGNTVWFSLWDGSNPNSTTVQASYASVYQSWMTVLKDYVVIRNIRFIVPWGENGYSASATGNAVNASGNNLLLQDLTIENGHCSLDLQSNRTMMELNGTRCLDKINGPSSPSAIQSGLRFYNVEIRGGIGNTLTFDSIRGSSTSSPVMFDRIYLHRGWTGKAGNCSGCSNTGYNCTTRTYNDSNVANASAHGAYLGSSASGTVYNVGYAIVQNSVIELTFDGWSFFSKASVGNVIFRNNTFGYSGSTQGNFRSELAQFGVNDSPSPSATFYNNLFYVDDITGSNFNGSIINFGGGSSESGAALWGGVVSDYNMYLHPWNAPVNIGANPLWNGFQSREDLTLAQMITTYGQDSHSRLVCYSGCSSSPGAVFNDGLSSRSSFVRDRPSTGAPSDYTPASASARMVNAGLASQCPAYDFYGNPRSDGQCDIGAVELQGGVEPAGPHRTDIRPGTKLR